MTYRLVTTFALVIVTTLLTIVSLGERSFSNAATWELVATPLSSDSLERWNAPAKNLEQLNGGNVYLHSTSTITATDVTTHYVFLPIVVKPAVPAVVLQVLAETNAERIEAGCPPLTLNPQLTDAAQGHSLDMALNDFFSHTGSNGFSPEERIQATGYQYWRMAENIAAGYCTPEAVMAAWMNSDGHRRNILDCRLEEIGVGYYYLKDDGGDAPFQHYWTQVFATPR
jgi:uncharacterized protein YkwD